MFLPLSVHQSACPQSHAEKIRKNFNEIFLEERKVAEGPIDWLLWRSG